MSGSRSILLFLAVSVACLQKINCDFETDFLGNFLSDEEYNNRSFCHTPVCMQDAGRLIYNADHNSQVTNPCDDFKTFAMGEFFKHRVLNERYPLLGFQSDTYSQLLEKQKRMLGTKIVEDDPKMFKVIKSFFKKCVDRGFRF